MEWNGGSTTQVNSIHLPVTVKRESKLTQKLQRSFSCRPSWKRSFSPNTWPGTLSSDVHPSNEHRFFCVPECSSLRMYFIHLPSMEWTTHNLSTVNIFSAPPMYNFSCSVADHDDFLPAVIMVQSPCPSSQCTSTHSATEHVHSRHYLRPRTVVPSTSNVAPTTCTIDK